MADDDDAGLPGVVVTVSDSSGKWRRQVLTGADGSYAVFGLASGTYRVVAELDGFTSVSRTAWVPAGRTARIELTMRMAEVVEEIVVTSELPSHSFTSTAAARDELENHQRQQAAQVELASMQGLVGGVKPLAVEIPESGKLLLLAGVLPPAVVSVELEVKRRR